MPDYDWSVWDGKTARGEIVLRQFLDNGQRAGSGKRRGPVPEAQQTEFVAMPQTSQTTPRVAALDPRSDGGEEADVADGTEPAKPERPN